MIIADPLNVMTSDRHLEPPEPDQYIGEEIRDSRYERPVKPGGGSIPGAANSRGTAELEEGIRYIVSKAMPELLTIQLEVPPEPNEEIDFVGLCECEACRKAADDPDVHPKEIWRGTAYFKLDNRLIHWECLQDYLISRQRIGG